MKIVILDNIRSVYNVGSIFRTANAVGIDAVYLCGITPTPLDKKGQRRKDFAKVALGAEDTITWKFFETTLGAVIELKNQDYEILAVEQSSTSVDYKSYVPTNKNIALIMGSEVDGIESETLDLCDATLEIPMRGTKESLNVTIAFGIVCYRLFDM